MCEGKGMCTNMRLKDKNQRVAINTLDKYN